MSNRGHQKPKTKINELDTVHQQLRCWIRLCGRVYYTAASPTNTAGKHVTMLEWNLTTIAFTSLVGGAVGVLSGMFGVGGGFLLVPVLNAVLGVPMQIAVGSTACYTLGPATVAMLSRKPRSGFIELPLILSGGLFVGVWAGAKALSYLATGQTINLLGRKVAAMDLTVLSCYAVLMVVIATLSLVDSRRSVIGLSGLRRGLLTSVQLRPMARIPDLRPGIYSIPLLSWLGLCVGLLSGFLGMSGGLILVPAAIYLLGLRVHDAATVTIAIVWMVSLQSTLMHAMYGNVQRSLVVALLICGTIGAGLGAQIGVRMKSAQLKFGFGLLVAASAAIVITKIIALCLNATPAGATV